MWEGVPLSLAAASAVDAVMVGVICECYAQRGRRWCYRVGEALHQKYDSASGRDEQPAPLRAAPP